MPVMPALVISGLSTRDGLDRGSYWGIVSFSFAFIEQIFCTITSIILLIVFDCRYRQRDRECIAYIITSSFLNIPTFAMIIMIIASYLINPSGIYHSNGSEYNYWSAFAEAINSFFGTFGICVLLCSVATISVLIKFCHINHRLKNPDYVYK